MWRFYAALVLAWLALLPPLFTDGACTAEYDRASAHALQKAAAAATLEAAAQLFRLQGLPVSLLSPDQCRQAKPRALERCGSGAWVYVRLPVEHRICSFYRDSDVKVQLQFDDRQRLQWVKSDMAPDKTLPLPFGWPTLHWAH